MTEHTVNQKSKTAATDAPCPTQVPTTANLGTTLSSAVADHALKARASFHMPGHKGRQKELFARLADAHNHLHLDAKGDLTELPGLDDLSAPTGLLQALENAAANYWHSGEAIISVGGATAAITAAILAAASDHPSNTHIIVPRNAHRSVVHALCLARLEPIWCEPSFDSDWGVWSAVRPEAVATAIAQAQVDRHKVACVVVVSPTYGGAFSDIKSIAAVAHEHAIPLIVDEAHGALAVGQKHPDAKQDQRRYDAIACGADAVAHSWHKTLPALTQTGMLHLAKNGLLNSAGARSALTMISTSSPSYLLLDSMQKTQILLDTQGDVLKAKIKNLATIFKSQLADTAVQVYQSTVDGAGAANIDSHLLLAVEGQDPQHLYDYLAERGIFAEAVLGKGVLFMLGSGSELVDIELATEAIRRFADSGKNSKKTETSRLFAPPQFSPVIAPHKAMLMPKQSLPKAETIGHIAAQCLAPCPPGIPILIPGQKITEEVLELVSDKTIMVVAPEGRSLLEPGETN